MKRTPVYVTKGHPAVDGAGVKLVRVLGYRTTKLYDPFLMLDSFDSTNPDDYVKGFPTHPHRGIETITYLSQGIMEHQDSLGNKGVINPGEVQWMNGGGGILHQEMPKPAPRMLGVQVWLNLPAEHKFSKPTYNGFTKEDIPQVAIDGGTLGVIGGTYLTTSGYIDPFVPINFYTIKLAADHEFELVTPNTDAGFLFLLEGDAFVADEKFSVKTAVKLSNGDSVMIKSLDQPIEILYLGGPPLKEPIAWMGPIVMNNDLELREAENDLRNGTFLRHKE